jgi:hypothetical protein
MIKSLFVPALMLSLGLGAGGFFIGDGISGRNSGTREISVKGLAEKEVPATVAIWTVGFRSSDNELVGLKAKLKENTRTVIAFLTSAGFDPKDIAVQPPSIQDTSMDERDKDTPPPPFRYNGFQSVLLRTTKVDAVKPAQAAMSDLITNGVMLTARNDPTYIFDALNAIKPGMIQEATRNARIAADQFSKDSETKLGKLRNASQGWFQVENRDEATPERKVIRVIVEVVYEVE